MSDWYKQIDSTGPLQQGDFLKDVPVYVPDPDPSSDDDNPSGSVVKYNVVILSQSCDLEQEKLEYVLVGPMHSLNRYAAKFEHFGTDKGKESLRRGFIAGCHLLMKCDLCGYGDEFLVVDFKSVISVPFPFIRKFAESHGDRVRLLPPYREHLSQAFARFFMRVGLPVDIPAFAKAPDVSIT